MTDRVLLSVRGLEVRYGHIRAVKGIDLDVRPGEIACLVGANGAGKSSTLLALSGLLGAGGSMRFEDEELLGRPPHEIVRRGIVQVPEGREILTTLTVRENIDLGAHTRRDRAAAIARDREWVMGLFPVLAERATGLAGNLSGGEQQMLAIARALMARPRLLLLDEPSMGLAPLLVRDIFRVLAEINGTGIAMLLVEQNVRQALKIARHGYVLENGRVVHADEASRLLDDPRVVEAYLGG